MRFEVYPDPNGEWRWRLRATNGRIVADSAESYKRRASADRAIASIKRLAEMADVREIVL